MVRRRKRPKNPTEEGRTIDWAACLPQAGTLKDIEDLMRKLQADKQTRVSTAQSLAYGISLAESSSARLHCALIGIRFTTTLVLGPQLVAFELAHWPRTPETVGVRCLFERLTHHHLPHSLLDEDRKLDTSALQLFQESIRTAILQQSHRDASIPLARSAPDYGPDGSAIEQEFQWASRTLFSVAEEDRLSVVSTARSVSTQQATSKAHAAGGCSVTTGGGGRPDQGDGSAGGFGGPSSAGTGPTGDAAARSGESRSATTTTTSSVSTQSQKRTATTTTSADNALAIDLGEPLPGLNISDQLGPEDFASQNESNLALPLGADAESFAAGLEVDSDLLASYLVEEKKGPLNVKRWVQAPENGDFVLAVLTAALEELGCRILVVSPSQMEKLRAEQRAAVGTRAHQAPPSPAVASPTPPELGHSDGTSSPSPVSTAQFSSVPLPHVPGGEQPGVFAHNDLRLPGTGREHPPSIADPEQTTEANKAPPAHSTSGHLGPRGIDG